MAPEVAYKAVDYFLNNSRKQKSVTIGFYGGEPLLNFRLIQEVVKQARKKAGRRKIDFNMTTNGTVMPDEILDFMVKNKVKLLVSLDGPEDIHDRYRVFKNGQGSFKVIRQNLGKILTRNEKYYYSHVSFNVVVAPPYDMIKIYEFINENEKLFKSAQVSVSSVHSSEKGFFNQFTKEDLINRDYRLMEKTFVDEVVATGKVESVFLRNLIETTLIRIYKRDMGCRMSEYMYPNGICIPGLRRVFVSTDGLFHICEKMNENFPIGDVEKGLDFGKIKNIIDQYVQKSAGRCRRCWAVRLCSLCFLSATTDRFDFKLKEKKCRVQKLRTLHALKLYCQILERNPGALDYMKNIVVS